MNLSQRVAFVIGLGVGLLAFGGWVTDLGTSLPRGWVAYSPLSQPAIGGLYSWVKLLVWLIVALTWTVVAVWLLRGSHDTPSRTDPPQN